MLMLKKPNVVGHSKTGKNPGDLQDQVGKKLDYFLEVEKSGFRKVIFEHQIFSGDRKS